MSIADSKHFCNMLAANVSNKGLSDAEFRQFVRNSLSAVDYQSKGATQCDLPDCTDGAALEGWARITDLFSGEPTGRNVLVSVCTEHRDMLIGDG